jgi:DNA-binding MarR family transcriptional regulator
MAGRPRTASTNGYVRDVPDPAIDPLELSRRYWDEDELGDPSLFFAMVSVMRVSRRMMEPIDGVLRGYGLGLTAYLLLMSLDMSANGSMILGRLARELIVHPTTITLTIDRLEEDKLVKKTPHETDGRATRATITRAGRTVARKVTRELSEVSFGLGDLSKAQTAKLTAALTNARFATGDIPR